MSSVKEKTLRKYSSDLLSLQRLLLKTVKNQQASSRVTQKEAIELLHHLHLMLSEQSEQLEARVAHLGGNFREEVKNKVAGWTGSIAGIVDSARKDPVSKMLRDDYTALSMLAVGYKMLYTTALIGNDRELAGLTSEHLHRLARMITETSRVVPVIVAREMEDDPKRAEEIGRKAVEETHKAWKAENIHAGPEIVQS